MEHHVYTNTRKVLTTINSAYENDEIDVLVFQHKGDHEAEAPKTKQELAELLKGYDKVYSFYECESNAHWRVFDIILEK